METTIYEEFARNLKSPQLLKYESEFKKTGSGLKVVYEASIRKEQGIGSESYLFGNNFAE